MTDKICTICAEIFDGFTITCDALVEYSSLRDMYLDDTDSQLAGMEKALENYDSVLFCARVTASKNGINLASNYLGGCHYASYEDFCIKYRDDYYIDMIKSTVSEAKEVIKGLML